MARKIKINPMARALRLKQFSQKITPTKKERLNKVKHKKLDIINDSDHKG